MAKSPVACIPPANKQTNVKNPKMPNFTVSCLPGLYQFERPHLTGSCDFWAQRLALGDLDYDEVEADNLVQAEKLDSDEAFEVEP